MTTSLEAIRAESKLQRQLTLEIAEQVSQELRANGVWIKYASKLAVCHAMSFSQDVAVIRDRAIELVHCYAECNDDSLSR